MGNWDNGRNSGVGLVGFALDGQGYGFGIEGCA